MVPIDLQKMFGGRFRIIYDPSYDVFHVPKAKRDPWMMCIPCQFGMIYPYSDVLLAAEVDYHPKTAKQLQALTGVALTQDGDYERTFTFSLAVFEQVAAILKPRKRRILTEEQKARLASVAKPFGKRQDVAK
jgi:hypothetical protein